MAFPHKEADRAPLTGSNAKQVSTASSTAEGVETLLARALERASLEGRWEVVAQLAAELAARRVAEPVTSNVVALVKKRR